MRRLLSPAAGVLVLALALAVSRCGGSSSPAAPTPTPTPSSTAPVIASISPSKISAGVSPLTVTLTGSNFASGLSLAITHPGGSLVGSGGMQLGAITSTTVQVTVVLSSPGTYTFQITSSAGEKSNALGTTVQAATAWAAEGVRLAEASGLSNITNVTAWQTSEGRWRYLVSRNGGIYSAISTDGLSITLESGPAKYSPTDCGHSRALKLDDGRVRVYCRDNTGLLTYISSNDGGTFSREGSGYFITNAQVGAPRLTMGGVVRAKDGRWRMYFADETTNNQFAQRIMSAVSTDLLNWTVEAGTRIGANTTQSGSATHPSAIVNADGSVSVAYNQSAFPGSAGVGIWVATSSDGLTFTRDEQVALEGADPDIHIMNGVTRFYYTACQGFNSADNPVCSARLVGTLAPLLGTLSERFFGPPPLPVPQRLPPPIRPDDPGPPTAVKPQAGRGGVIR